LGKELRHIRFGELVVLPKGLEFPDKLLEFRSPFFLKRLKFFGTSGGLLIDEAGIFRVFCDATFGR